VDEDLDADKHADRCIARYTL